ALQPYRGFKRQHRRLTIAFAAMLFVDADEIDESSSLGRVNKGPHVADCAIVVHCDLPEIVSLGGKPILEQISKLLVCHGSRVLDRQVHHRGNDLCIILVHESTKSHILGLDHRTQCHHWLHVFPPLLRQRRSRQRPRALPLGPSSPPHAPSLSIGLGWLGIEASTERWPILSLGSARHASECWESQSP